MSTTDESGPPEPGTAAQGAPATDDAAAAAPTVGIGPPGDGGPIRLGAERITRAFGPVVANADVSLRVRAGSVHAVVGENGAGKSTLMRILYGLDRPDSGSVIMAGQPVVLKGPADGLVRAIGIVQQELALVPELTLLENLVLGAEPRRRFTVDWRAARGRAEELAASAGLTLPWSERAANVPVGMQQQLEILRLLYRGVDVLILDEPTAVLAPAQVEELLRLLRDLRRAGRTIVFISHKLDEVLAIADEITVMRGGRTVGTVAAASVDRTRLAELIVGERVPTTIFVPSSRVGAAALDVCDLSVDDDRGNRRLDSVTLTVRAGEIVGVAGVAGNGQDELVDCLVGLRRCTAGNVRLAPGAASGRDGFVDITAASVGQRRRLGLAYVSADRTGEGLALRASLRDNVLAGFHRGRVSRYGWLRRRAVTNFVRDVLDRFSVRHSAPDDEVGTLSGGNQQRLVIGRELAHDPVLLVASQPTRGVDIRGIAQIHEVVRGLRDAGKAVLLVSEELDELQALSDRIVVLYRGRIVGEVAGGADRVLLGRLMLGEGALE
jgi:simple sugar transport system ATP-binding protein